MITCFNCERLYNRNKEEKLSCFIGYVNKINVYTFTYDYNNEKLKLYSNKIISNNGAKILKTISSTVYSSSNAISNSLVCFIDYFYDNSSCIKYNLENYQTTEYPNPHLSISTNLFIEKADYQYFIFNFYSSTEFSLIKLDSYFTNSVSKDYIINIDSIKNNANYYFSVLINDDNVNDIFILLNNDENDFNLIKHKAEVTNLNIIDNDPIILSDLLSYKIDKIINNIIVGKKFYIIEENFNISIYSTNNINDEDESFIDLLNCETKLKQGNNVDLNNKLIIVLLEIFSDNSKTLTNNIKLVIYDENKKKLNLSVCDGEKVKINYKMKKNYEIIQKIEKFSLFGIDILDIDSPFFNDICSDDIIINGEFFNLEERINNLYVNYSICDNNCEYEKINIKKLTISCICTSLLSIESKTESPAFKQKNLSFQYTSLNIMKCKKFFFVKNTLKNAGFWISIISLIIRIILYIKYSKTGINPIKDYVEKEMKKYHYDTEENETNNIDANINQNQNNNKNVNTERENIKNDDKKKTMK